MFRTKYRCLVVTTEAIYVLDSTKRTGGAKPVAAVGQMSRTTPIGPGLRSLAEVHLLGKRHWVHKRFHDRPRPLTVRLASEGYSPSGPKHGSSADCMATPRGGGSASDPSSVRRAARATTPGESSSRTQPGASRTNQRADEAGLKRCITDLPGCAGPPGASRLLTCNGMRPRSRVPNQPHGNGTRLLRSGRRARGSALSLASPCRTGAVVWPPGRPVPPEPGDLTLTHGQSCRLVS